MPAGIETGANTRMLAGDQRAASTMRSRASARASRGSSGMGLFDQTSALPSNGDRNRRRADHRPTAFPSYAHPGDAGADLHRRRVRACSAPGERATVGTGVAIALPDGYVAFVVPRSGPRRQARHHDRQRAGHGRCRLPRRDQGHPAQHRRRASRTTIAVGDRIAQLIVMPVTPGAVRPGRAAARQHPRRRRASAPPAIGEHKSGVNA